jgi:hypothetical protein
MANDDIVAMSDSELMDAWTAAGDQASELKERLSAFSAEYQTRCYNAQVQAQFGPMNAEQKQAAIDAINATPDPIESEEAVHTSVPSEEATV